MKTYLVDSLNEALRIGKKLDSVSQIQNKEWTVFTDDSHIKETYMFLKKGRLINSINGIISYFKWEYIPVNASILIENDKHKFLFKIVVCDEKILVLNLDGTQEYCFLINTTKNDSLLLSYEDIQWYLIRRRNIDILDDHQRRDYEEENRKKEELRKIEMEKEQKETDEFLKIFLLVIVGIILVIFLLFWIKNSIET